MGICGMNRFGGWWLCILLLEGGPLWAQEEEAQEPQTLEEKVEELEQKIRIIERKDELEKEQAAEKAKTASKSTSGSYALSLRSTEGADQLKLRGYVQFDGGFFQEDEERP